ncbi:MAG: PilZ domain-containing protein [Nitrospirae bacterium]|nr:PilZ domain-containing protein [Nitrospirota bacterium]
MPNRRAFQRFDVITVLEFKLLTAIAATFTGITRNFSYEGFCLETQCVTFEPGDSLEVSLRHPHHDLTVSVPALVVWKKNAEKFAYLMGIKLKETELDTRLRMLEIMSAAGEVPVDSFLSEGSDDGTGKEETGVQIPQLSLQPADKAASEPAETVDVDTGVEAFRDEKPLSIQEGLFTGKKPVSAFDEVLRQAQAEGPDDEDMINDEPLESDMPWPKADAAEEKTAHATNVLTKLIGNRMLIYSSSTLVLLAVLIYTLSLIIKSPDISIKSPVPVPAPSTSPQEEALIRPVPPAEIAGTDKAEAPAVQPPDEQHVSTTESSKPIEQDVPAASQQPPVISVKDDKAQYVQVGAWRNPENAKEMLQKIKELYPDAYLVSGTKLIKVKIPVKDKTQGNRIIKDIEGKFNIKPMLTPEK